MQADRPDLGATDATWPSFGIAVVVVALLAMCAMSVDLWTGGPLFSLIFQILVGAPWIVFTLATRERSLRRWRLAGTAVLVLCGIVVWSTSVWQYREIKEAMGRTQEALEKFRVSTGEYPDELAQLVPEFLDAVPEVLRLVRSPGHITYQKRNENYFIMHLWFPFCRFLGTADRSVFFACD